MGRTLSRLRDRRALHRQNLVAALRAHDSRLIKRRAGGRPRGETLSRRTFGTKIKLMKIRKPSPAKVRASLRLLIDSAAGYNIDRRAELEAVLVVRASSVTALMKAYMKLPRREDDHLRVVAIIARISQPGFVEQARIELAELDQR